MEKNDLPTGWKRERVSNICNVISGATPKTENPDYWGGEIFWMTPKDLSNYSEKYISHTSRTITQKGYDSCSTQIISPGNILMSSRAPIGYLVINKVPMCTNQGFKSFEIISKEVLNEDYLYYYLKSIVEQIKKIGSGTTFNEVSKSKASGIEIAYPSLEMQKLIVQEIEKQFTRLGDTIQSLQEVKKKLEHYRKAVLKKAFEKKRGWEEKTLGDVCEKITDGSHNPPKKQREGIKMLSAVNIGNNSLILEKYRLISKKDFEVENRRTNIKENDILLTIVGTIGRSLIVKEEYLPFALQRSVAVLKPKDKIDPPFLRYLVSSPLLQQGFLSESRGVAQKGIYLGLVKKQRIYFPSSIQEQRKIVQDLESKFSVIDNVEAIIDASLKKTEKLKKSILKVAFEGRLVQR